MLPLPQRLLLRSVPCHLLHGLASIHSTPDPTLLLAILSNVLPYRLVIQVEGTAFLYVFHKQRKRHCLCVLDIYENTPKYWILHVVCIVFKEYTSWQSTGCFSGKAMTLLAMAQPPLKRRIVLNTPPEQRLAVGTGLPECLYFLHVEGNDLHYSHFTVHHRGWAEAECIAVLCPSENQTWSLAFGALCCCCCCLVGWFFYRSCMWT